VNAGVSAVNAGASAVNAGGSAVNASQDGSGAPPFARAPGPASRPLGALRLGGLGRSRGALPKASTSRRADLYYLKGGLCA